MVNITLHANSTFKILAATVFVVLSVGTVQNNAELIQFGEHLFNILIFGVIATTFIINDSKPSRGKSSR